MTDRTVYYTEPVPGCGHRRYCIGHLLRDGRMVVTRVQVSRPDGTEIARPVRITHAPAAPVQPAPLARIDRGAYTITTRPRK